MHPQLSGAIKTVLLGAGYYSRRLPAIRFPGAAVLCYHGVRAGASRGRPFEPLHVPVDTFEQHCRLIRSACDPIGADDLLAALDSGAPLPPRAVLVTFDDGYRSVLTLAAPILERYGIPAVVFVCSDPVERGRLLWYDAVGRSRGEGEAERLKGLPFADWQRAVAAYDLPASADEDYAPLSVADLRRLSGAAGIEIGGHSRTHPILSKASADEQQRQIGDDKRALEAWTGRPLRLFSYPNGRPRVDYTAATCEIVERVGYRAAFTTEGAYATGANSRFELPRFLLLDSISAPVLAHRFAFGWIKRQ
jgi:peptidoglycan/xylan/chitin deacetylase (PgdA/CDA1 family)